MELFQPDSILAPQFFATLRRQAPSKKGEWQLLIAVLEDAVFCFQKYLFAKDSHGKRLFREASDWMMNPSLSQRFGRDNESPSFSFEYICEVLGLDPDYLRRGLRSWTEQQVTSGLARILAGGMPVRPVLQRDDFDVVLAAAARPATAITDRHR